MLSKANLFILLLLVGIGCTSTTEGPKDQRTEELQPVQEITLPSDISELITLLGSDDWETREKATNKLIAIGESAIESLKKALKHPDPEVKMRATLILNKFRELTDARFYLNRICLSFKEGNHDKMIADVEKILELNPKDKDMYYNVGIICDEYLDRPDLAIKCYKKYLELTPKDDPERSKIEQWKNKALERLKNREEKK